MANGGIQIFEQDGSLLPNAPVGKYIGFLALDGTWKKKDDSGVITPMYEADTDLNNKIAISSGDTTPDFLDAKLIGTPNKITLTILNTGANEQYQIDIGSDILQIGSNHSDLTLDDGTNPHGTTQSDVGLGNVDNTSDLDKPISTDTQTALDGKKDDFTENTAFNKDFGTTAGTVLEGNTPTITGTEQTKLGFITVTSAINLDNLIEPFAVDLDSAESSVTRVESGGRTNYTITHNLNTLDLNSEVFRLSDGRTIGWSVERTGVNTVVASRAGSIANGLFRIILK